MDIQIKKVSITHTVDSSHQNPSKEMGYKNQEDQIKESPRKS